MHVSPALLNSVKQATELAEKAQNLSDSLKDVAIGAAETSIAGEQFVFAITIFVLACFVGYYVVWKVTPALHTPLMAVTNAISGIIIIGAMIAAAPASFSLASSLGYLGVFFAAINIFGGFVVTERMLEMFKKK